MSEIIKFENVNKFFKDGDITIEALKRTNFSINEGELVGIIGPSGSGKSTLLTLMGGLQSPSNGRIYFEDSCINELKEKERNDLRFDKIGFILQSYNLVPYLTVLEQFQLVNHFKGNKFEKERALEILKSMGMGHRIHQYPSELSGGEKQRVAIARALYPNPRLILADEPTAALDSYRAMAVVQLLKELTETGQRSIVMVTHDQRLLDYCDRIFRIEDGVLREVEKP